MTRAIVFVNGEWSDHAFELANVSENDLLVCVDGGANHCIAMGLSPDILIGDLDSIDAEVAGSIQATKAEHVKFPSKKNASDLELALQLLCERSVSELVLLGMSGGRTDHFLFNWQLAASREWPFSLRIIDSTADARIVRKQRPLSLSTTDDQIGIEQIFSVIPLVEGAEGVCVVGAAYPLSNASLSLGSTLGLSNVVQEKQLKISVSEGVVMALFVHAHIN